MDIGTVIRENRIRVGLTQTELGVLCGYKPQSGFRVVYDWEHNRKDVPNVRLRALSKALKVPLDYLVP